MSVQFIVDVVGDQKLFNAQIQPTDMTIGQLTGYLMLCGMVTEIAPGLDFNLYLI